jgi:peptidyl-prolyl cis-trans isomerase SurA
MTPLPRHRSLVAAAVFAGLMAAATLLPAAARAARSGDFIVAVVNQELVTNGEVEQRLGRVQAEAQRSNQQLPPPSVLRQQIVDALIDERVIVTHARDAGIRVEEPDVDRAVASVATQNQISVPQLRERLRASGIEFGRFRSNVRDQLLIERVREREVNSRIRIADADVDAYIAKQRAQAASLLELNLAQILVPVAEGASVTEAAARRARIDAALARVKDGEPFDKVAREVSEDANKDRGGEIGLKPADRLPDVFVEAVRNLKPGQVGAEPIRTGAGFHVLKLLERKEGSGFATTQTHARHILLRTSDQVQPAAAAARLQEFKRQVESGARSFEALAKEFSEDGSAAAGGDLGWTSPGTFVPEFEETLNGLPIGGISAPVPSRFGVHLIQVVERRQVALDVRQVREQARNALREEKFDGAYQEWARELRDRAYVEMREPPQ